jgi:hypothetical protein
VSTQDAKDLTEEVYQRYLLWDEEMWDIHLAHVLTCVGRNEAEQAALFAQGRYPLWAVNAKRKVVGWPPITGKENHKVTWTMKSLHITTPEQPLSRAFDFAIVRPGTRIPEWTLKVDTNVSGGSDYLEAGKLWEKVGGVWGGRWSTPDCPHCQ